MEGVHALFNLEEVQGQAELDIGRDQTLHGRLQPLLIPFFGLLLAPTLFFQGPDPGSRRNATDDGVLHHWFGQVV